MRWLWVVLGAIMLVAGVIWLLQGLGVIGGSVMSGNTAFVVIGPIVGLIGLGLVVLSLTGRRAPSA
jgi:hypothetical protein